MVLWGAALVWLVGIFALALWIPENAQHEGAHAIVAKSFGAKIARFWPFPGNKLGYFTWAHVIYASAPGFTNAQHALVSIAPLVASTAVLVLSSLIMILAPDHVVLDSFLRAWMITSGVDGAVLLSTLYYPEPTKPARTDGWKFMQRTGIPMIAGRIFAVAWTTIMVLLVIFA